MIRRLQDRVRSRFKLPVSEVAAQNTWQRVVLGFSVVGSDHQVVESRMDQIASFLTAVGERDAGAELVGLEREVLVYGDEPFGNARMSGPRGDSGGAADDGAGGDDAGEDSWIPDAWRRDLD